jgi:hypothetical protein
MKLKEESDKTTRNNAAAHIPDRNLLMIISILINDYSREVCF